MRYRLSLAYQNFKRREAPKQGDHDAGYQSVTRCSGGTYILSPGLTENAL
jgi:hypothetical protein